jgi:hypothetical protein
MPRKLILVLSLAFAMLRYCGAGVEAWKRRTSALLLLHIGESPEPEQPLSN